MKLASAALETGASGGHGHLVEFYETEQFLVDAVRAFLVPTLRDGNAAIVMATAEHRQGFETALGDAGIDVDAAVREDRFIAFDAAELLSRFMVDRNPDPTLFREAIGPAMDRAAQGGRLVRGYCEMVALLWGEGDVASALALEDLWNDLAEARPFVALCACPMSALDTGGSAAQFKRLCEQHTTVIPSEDYSLLDDPADRSRAVAQMQQRAEALHAEVRLLRAQQERASHDDLTGAYLRGEGFMELEREIVRANRTGQPLVAAFVDVDHLKDTNDSQGHAAGDRMLLEVVKAFRANLRSYDLIIRYGGDEFVCAMSGVAMAGASKRIEFVNAALAANPELGSITVGLAELEPGDSPEDLIARADAALYRARQLQRSISSEGT